MSVRVLSGDDRAPEWARRLRRYVAGGALILTLLVLAASCGSDTGPGEDATAQDGTKAPTVVVWTEWVPYGVDSSYQRLHCRDLDRGPQWDLGGSEEVYVDDPAVSGHVMVWMRDRDEGGHSQRSLVVRDLVTGKEQALPDSDGARPQISGGWVVWHQGVEAEGGYRSLLVARNLTSGLERVVEGGVGELFVYSLSGDWLVWPVGHGIYGDRDEIWGMRLSTGKRTLLRRKGPWGQPVAAGDWVLYGRSDQHRVEALDLASGKRRLLPRDATTACDGERVVMVTYNGGEDGFRAGRDRMAVYDLRTRRTTEVPVPAEAGLIRMTDLAIHEDWVIWWEGDEVGRLWAINYVSGETELIEDDASAPSISKD